VTRLADRRLLVVGASSGIGRAVGVRAAAEGAHVAFAARRTERLEEAAAAAGPACVALACDVEDEGACDAVVREAVAALGGLDAFVYAPGIAVFKPLAETTADDWHRVLATNLVGASAVTRAAVPHLEGARGKAVFLSSITIDDHPPRPSNAAYGVSKVALETLVRAWQGEHPAVAFSTVAIGDTVTEFGSQLDPAAIVDIVQAWTTGGYMYGRAMDPESVAEQVIHVLASRETVRRVAITPGYAL